MSLPRIGSRGYALAMMDLMENAGLKTCERNELPESFPFGSGGKTVELNCGGERPISHDSDLIRFEMVLIADVGIPSWGNKGEYRWAKTRFDTFWLEDGMILGSRVALPEGFVWGSAIMAGCIAPQLRNLVPFIRGKNNGLQDYYTSLIQWDEDAVQLRNGGEHDHQGRLAIPARYGMSPAMTLTYNGCDCGNC